MKLSRALTINGKAYKKGDQVSPVKMYPFFLFHMAMFGGSGFFMAYFVDDVPLSFLYMHGGFALFVYSIFYITMFGLDQVKWMFINAFLGIYGLYVEIDWFLSLAGKRLSDYPLPVHVIPFLYYVLYTFLIRQAVLDIAGARDDLNKQKRVNLYYVIVSLIVYSVLGFIG